MSIIFYTVRLAARIGLILAVGAMITGASFFGYTKLVLRETSKVVTPTKTAAILPSGLFASSTNPFPVGVDVVAMQINENPLVDTYVKSYLSVDVDHSRKGRFLARLWGEIAKLGWYQNLASSVSRILVVYPGERHEEVVDNFGDILKWNDEERKEFTLLVTDMLPALTEGKFYPGRYVVEVDASPARVAEVLNSRFTEEVLSRYDVTVAKEVPLKDALTIASLLEREAYDFTDMRIISGIIWNRLFIDMPLQLDATLQYARGAEAGGSLWWPKVVPDDKYIDSPFNTYEIAGLPPAPIANPSVEAVVAALNPKETECYFYFHDADGNFYCTVTYEEHVAKLKEIYGQGK